MRLLVLDLDGVLTDGKQYIDHTGEKLFKAFHTRDIRAIRELVADGVEVHVLSADDWEGGRQWSQRVGAGFGVCRDKLEFLQSMPYPTSEFGIIGDDAWDMSAMRWVAGNGGVAACPFDADASVKELPGILLLGTRSGEGVVADFVRRLRSLD